MLHEPLAQCVHPDGKLAVSSSRGWSTDRPICVAAAIQSSMPPVKVGGSIVTRPCSSQEVPVFFATTTSTRASLKHLPEDFSPAQNHPVVLFDSQFCRPQEQLCVFSVTPSVCSHGGIGNEAHALRAPRQNMPVCAVHAPDVPHTQLFVEVCSCVPSWAPEHATPSNIQRQW